MRMSMACSMYSRGRGTSSEPTRTPRHKAHDAASPRPPPRAVDVHGRLRLRIARAMSDLHVEVIGQGPPLVLLHGWAMHGGVFAPLVARLRDRYTLHVVDLPGHGLSRESTVPLALAECASAIAENVPVA